MNNASLTQPYASVTEPPTKKPDSQLRSSADVAAARAAEIRAMSAPVRRKKKDWPSGATATYSTPTFRKVKETCPSLATEAQLSFLKDVQVKWDKLADVKAEHSADNVKLMHQAQKENFIAEASDEETDFAIQSKSSIRATSHEARRAVREAQTQLCEAVIPTCRAIISRLTEHVAGVIARTESQERSAAEQWGATPFFPSPTLCALEKLLADVETRIPAHINGSMPPRLILKDVIDL